MTSLAPGEIRARRRPFVVLGVAVGRIVGGLCLAMPLASLLAESGIGLRAEGDRALFEGGGYLLLEVLRLHGPALIAVARGLLPVFVLGLLFTALSNAALLVALNTREELRSLGWLTRAAARLPALCILGLGTAITQGLVLLFAAMAAGSVPEALERAQRATLLQGLLWLAALALAGAIGGVSDVTKAALIRHDCSLPAALAHSWQGLSSRPIFSTFGWLPYGALFVAAAAAAAALAEALDVSRPGTWRVLSVLVAHQAVIVLSVALRAAWFAHALRRVCAADTTRS